MDHIHLSQRSKPHSPVTHLTEVENLLSVPTEVLTQIFTALVYVDENFTASVASLAATCKRLFSILYGTRSIWTEMFTTSFDLFEHHKLADFDIVQEYKGRRLALNPSIQVRPIDKIYLASLISENKGHNVQMLIKARDHPKVQSLLRDIICEIYGNEEPGWESLAVIEILVSIDIRTANVILTHWIVRDRLFYDRGFLAIQDNIHRTGGYISAQFAHLSILYLLVHDPSLEILIPPPVKFPTISKLLKTTGVPLTHYFDIPCALALLSGHWIGYYSYRMRSRLDSAMRLYLIINESAGIDRTMANEPSATSAPQGTHVYKLHGHGTDEHGLFTINGFVWSTGEVCFTKFYFAGHSWIYRGRLLPWGIAGTWDGLFGGCFWIWKDRQEILL